MGIKRVYGKTGKDELDGKSRYFSDWQLVDETSEKTVLAVEEEIIGSEASIYLKGDCRTDTYNYIRQELRALYTADKSIVIHCDQLNYMANKVVNVLAETLQGIENLERGAIELRDVSPEVQKDLASIGLLNMLVIRKSEG